MSDQCFVCRKNTRIKKCNTCSLRAHNKCWAEYLKRTVGTQTAYPLSDTVQLAKSVQCPQCRGNIDRKTHQTRGNVKIAKQMTGSFLICTITDLLFLIDIVPDRKDKEQLCEKMFELISDNMWFVNQSPRMVRVLKNKLIEMKVIDNWDAAPNIYKKMFGANMPYDFITA